MFSVTCQASSGTEDIFDLSFEQLLDVNIDLASKTNETLQSVPSSITVFSKQQIENLAVNNAYDLINFIPGFQSTRGDWVGAVPKDHARGVYLDNGYILMMVNGERLNEVSFGKASVYTPFIPTAIIEKVEFIRGPGSALYGSNAFLGVMNIITQKQANHVNLGIGEHGLWQMSANWHQQLSQSATAFVNLAVDHQTGEHHQGIRDPLESVYAELGVTVGQWHINGRFNQTNLDKFINLGGYSEQNRHKSENTYLSVNYQWWKEEESSLTSKLFYGLHEIASLGMVLPSEAGVVNHDFLVGPFWRTRELTLSSDYTHRLSENLDLAAGFELRKADQFQAGVYSNYFDLENGQIALSEEFYLPGGQKVQEFSDYAMLKQALDQNSLYGQVKWRYNPDLTVFLGARFDDVQGIESKVSPRFAFVYSGLQQHTLKLQYGESFRTPVTNELYSNDDVTTGNPNLTSEFVKTTELVWQFNDTSFSSEIVIFQNNLNDFINKVPAPNSDAEFTFANAIDKKIQGIESTVSWQFSSGLELGINGTHLLDDPENASFKNFASSFITYRFDNLLMSLNANWRDSVDVELDQGERFSQSGYLLFGGSIQWQLTPEHKVSLKGVNLFNKDYVVFDPRVDNGEVPGQGRQLRLTYQYKF